MGLFAKLFPPAVAQPAPYQRSYWDDKQSPSELATFNETLRAARAPDFDPEMQRELLAIASRKIDSLLNENMRLRREIDQLERG